MERLVLEFIWICCEPLGPPSCGFGCLVTMVTPALVQVRLVRMISDRNSRRSKGIAYIEFVQASSVPLAIGLTGQRLLGVPIIVQASQV